jgi:WD40-like Beta Propeller Repeat
MYRSNNIRHTKNTIQVAQYGIRSTAYAICLFLLFVDAVPVSGQFISKMIASANNYYEAGAYARAGALYEEVYKAESGRNDMAFWAAESSYKLRNYQKAAHFYKLGQPFPKQSPIAGLRYARALKQSGRYAEAIKAFQQFKGNYRGDEEALIRGIVQNEINGCILGRDSSKMPVSVQLTPLPIAVNGIGDKASLFSNNHDQVFFKMDGLWLTTTPNDKDWLPAKALNDLPPDFNQYGQATLSPDGSRFYAVLSDTAKDRRITQQLYVFRRFASGYWSPAEPLRAYINMPGTQNTYPCIVHVGGRELLYFSSNRAGTYGGLDLYVCERLLDSDENDFSLPRNLGERVNTPGDEIAPFFDTPRRILYFSSNGHVTYGGFDIFKTSFKDRLWQRPQNLRLPYNSSADDLCFTLKNNGTAGFLLSNRLYDGKTNTQTNDIFTFTPPLSAFFITGQILHDSLNTALDGAMLTLYETSDNTLVLAQSANEGKFRLPVDMQQSYRLEISKLDFETEAILLGEQYRTKEGYDLTIRLKPTIGEMLAAPEQKTLSIHLETVSTFDQGLPRYAQAKNYGQLQTKPLVEQGLIKVILTGFSDRNTALRAVRELRAGAFPEAFLLE